MAGSNWRASKSICDKCDSSRVSVVNHIDGIKTRVANSSNITQEDRDVVLKLLDDAKVKADENDTDGITSSLNRASQYLISHSALRSSQKEINDIVDFIDEAEEHIIAFKNKLAWKDTNRELNR